MATWRVSVQQLSFLCLCCVSEVLIACFSAFRSLNDFVRFSGRLHVHLPGKHVHGSLRRGGVSERRYAASTDGQQDNRRLPCFLEQHDCISRSRVAVDRSVPGHAFRANSYGADRRLQQLSRQRH